MSTDQEEKTSNRQQWHERGMRPIASRTMTKEEILTYRIILVKSYGCHDDEIDYGFEPILDEHDVDRDAYIWLFYTLACTIAGQPAKRQIFRIKMPVPDSVRARANGATKKPRARASRPEIGFNPMVGMSPSTAPIQMSFNTVRSSRSRGFVEEMGSDQQSIMSVEDMLSGKVPPKNMLQIEDSRSAQSTNNTVLQEMFDMITPAQQATHQATQQASVSTSPSAPTPAQPKVRAIRKASAKRAAAAK